MPDLLPDPLVLAWTQDDRPMRLPLAADRPVTLGRDPAGDVVFADATVSRRHAEVFARDGRFWVHPLSRKNPTWLNGRLVVGEAPLAAGDVLRLAVTEMRVARADA